MCEQCIATECHCLCLNLVLREHRPYSYTVAYCEECEHELLIKYK